MSQHHSTVHEVAEDGHQLGIVARLELLPAEIVIFCLGGIRRQHITQHILLAGEILHILVRPHGPAAGSRYLVSLEVQELVGRHVLREDVAVAIGLQHRREDYAVEHDVVFSDEVHQLCVRALPPLLPVVRQEFHGVGDIADRSVEPDVENLALSTLHGHRHAPVEVAGDGTGLQASVQPALDLAVDVAAPLLMAFQNPFPKPGFVILQGQIPMGSLFLDRGSAAELGVGIDEFLGAEGGAALLALVAVGILVAALGAGAHYVAVCEEGLGLGVVVLLALLSYELALVVELAEEFGCILLVYLRTCAAVDIEIDAQRLETVGDYLVVFVHYVLRAAALLAGLDGDGHAVLVASAHIQHILPAQAEIPNVNIGGHIHAGQMPDMHRTIGVWQRTGHKGSLELLFHI